MLLLLGGLMYSDATFPNQWVRIPLALFLFALALLLIDFGSRIIKDTNLRPRRARSPEALFVHLVSRFPSAVTKEHLPTVLSYFAAGDFESAQNTTAQLLEKHPGDCVLLWLHTDILFSLGQFEPAEAAADRLITALAATQSSAQAEPEFLFAASGKRLFAIMLQDDGRFESECTAFLRNIISDHQKIILLDQLACIPLVQNKPHLYHSAECCIRKALAFAPNTLTLHGNLGALFAERGAFTDAEPLLRACHQSPALHDRGITSYYLARLAEHNRDLPTARKLAKQSIALYPEPWLTEKASTLLTRLKTHSKK